MWQVELSWSRREPELTVGTYNMFYDMQTHIPSALPMQALKYRVWQGGSKSAKITWSNATSKNECRTGDEHIRCLNIELARP